MMQSYISLLLCFLWIGLGSARPLVRNIQSTHEFQRLLEKHATETGLPVVVDFYSDSCGPCRMMAPIFKKVAGEFVDKAVFVKVDTNAQYELSARYQIRSLPTFAFFVDGKRIQTEVGGIGEAALRHHTNGAIRSAEIENVLITVDALKEYYQMVDPNKSEADVQSVFTKCIELVGSRKATQCAGSAANQLARKLRKKYGKAPKTIPRFSPEARKAQTESPSSSSQQKSSSSSSSSSSSQAKVDKANLHLATVEELRHELEKRMDEEREIQVEGEDADEDEADPDFHKWTPSSFPEKVIIVGGGPAGMSAAIYAARAGLSPLVIAPSMGGQLQGKGVMVENYPGMTNVTGPAVVAAMRTQAAHFGALFEDDFVIGIDATSRPLKVRTNATGVIETHSIIVATGAEANWLNIPGEWELRGAGVSSCATCDGFLFANQHVVVVGGGDAAAEDALVLARTSKSVTMIHRRDELRASKILRDRVLQHPSINVRWNRVVQEIIGKASPDQKTPSESEEEDLDNIQNVVAGVLLKDVVTGEVEKLDCDAVFIAIGHTPSTSFLQGVVEFDSYHTGYIKTMHGSTQTSVPGIFAAGDVADAVYRQAVTSAGSGAAAALDAERYLSENGLGNEADLLEAELMAELYDSTTTSNSDVYNAYEDAGGRVHGVKESMAAGEL